MRKVIKTNEVSKEAKATLKKRVLFALMMLAVFIPCLVLGGWFYLVLIVLVIGASTYEIATAPSHKLSWFVWAVTFVVMYSLIFWIMIKTNIVASREPGWQGFDINTSFTEINLSPIALAVMIGLYLFVVIIKNKEFRLVDACYLIAMTLLLALGFQAALCVRYLPFEGFKDALDTSLPAFKYGQSMFLMIYLLLAIFFNDIGAYLTGMLFGKHKMAPNISPKKTWEGFAGGVVTSIILSLTFGLVVAYCGFPMLPIFTIEKWYWIVLVSFILPFVGVLGDLAFSAIKRQFGKKDYSNVLGPHGGVLDRIDSTLFGALALVILIIFIANGWSFFQ